MRPKVFSQRVISVASFFLTGESRMASRAILLLSPNSREPSPSHQPYISRKAMICTSVVSPSLVMNGRSLLTERHPAGAMHGRRRMSRASAETREEAGIFA